jgi:hypothetical protein
LNYQDGVLWCDDEGFCKECQSRGDEKKVKFLWILSTKRDDVPKLPTKDSALDIEVRGYFCSFGHFWIENKPIVDKKTKVASPVPTNPGNSLDPTTSKVVDETRQIKPRPGKARTGV